MAPPLIYKFVELSIVTSETIEEAVNTWVGQGWHFDGVRFVTTEASRRPAMAFLSFVRDDPPPPPAADPVADELGVEPGAAPAADDVSEPASPSPTTRRRRR